jgi:ComF family protein
VKSQLRTMLRSIVDLILPPLCFSCKTKVTDPGTLCPTCWNDLSFLGKPCCHHCGWPFPYEVAHQTVCQACATKRPLFEQARSALIYDGVTRKLVLTLKHGDGTHLSKLMASWMEQAGTDILTGAHALIPVPLHWKRLLKRGYNQSALLAQDIHRKTGVPLQSSWLKRQRSTPSQGGLTRNQRQANVRSAFEVPTTKRPLLEGKVVVLIDDVYTTGSTLEACTRTLLKRGAGEVRVLTLARALKPTDISRNMSP